MGNSVLNEFYERCTSTISNFCYKEITSMSVAFLMELLNTFFNSLVAEAHLLTTLKIVNCSVARCTNFDSSPTKSSTEHLYIRDVYSRSCSSRLGKTNFFKNLHLQSSIFKNLVIDITLLFGVYTTDVIQRSSGIFSLNHWWSADLVTLLYCCQQSI